MRYFLKSSQKSNTINTISSYLERGYRNITIAYLFGSFITEEFFSDIDLAIYTQMEIARTWEFEIDLENRLERVVKFDIDARILNHAPLSFCQNVIRHGRVVIDRDPNLRADFEGKILKQYSDFSHFRRRYLAEVRNAPV